MDNKIYRLIVDYQSKVMEAVVLMKRSGIRMPNSSYEWIFLDLPFEGNLYGGGDYYKHGAGCLVNFNPGEVDFDFGENGEIAGFNAWWLTRFAGGQLENYGFCDDKAVAECLENAMNSGELIKSEDGLYYLSNAPLIFAVDLDCRVSGDILPYRDDDRVLVLYSHYFQTADLMLENYEKIERKWNKLKYLNQREKIEQRIYLSSWLGFLGVTCEGFRKLNMRFLLKDQRPENFNELIVISDDVGSLMKKHSDSLRGFRNNVFHLREDSKVVREFFTSNYDRLPWANDLHKALGNFFSKYQFECEMHYIKYGRIWESNLRRQQTRRKRSSS